MTIKNSKSRLHARREVALNLVEGYITYYKTNPATTMRGMDIDEKGAKTRLRQFTDQKQILEERIKSFAPRR